MMTFNRWTLTTDLKTLLKKDNVLCLTTVLEKTSEAGLK